MTTAPPPPPPADLPAAGTAAPKLATTEPAAREMSPADLDMLDELAVEWHDAAREIEKATSVKAAAAEAILALLPPGSTHMVPGTGVGVTVKRPSGRFDQRYALEQLGDDAGPALVETYDNGTLKALLKARGLGDGMAPGKGGGTVTAATGR